MPKALDPKVKAERAAARAWQAAQKKEREMKTRIAAEVRAETINRLPVVAMQPSTQFHHSFTPWDNIRTQCLWCWGWTDDWRHLAHPVSA